MPRIDLALLWRAPLPSPRPEPLPMLLRRLCGQPQAAARGGATKGGAGSRLSAVAFGGRAGSRFSLAPEAAPCVEPFASSTGTSVHGWTRPGPAGSGLAGGGPGGVSRGRTGPRPRVPEARGPTRPGLGTMMPGETHSAAPGTAADLSRCQGCASLQQVRRLPGRGLGAARPAGQGARPGVWRRPPRGGSSPPPLPAPSGRTGVGEPPPWCIAACGPGLVCGMRGGRRARSGGPLPSRPGLRAPRGRLRAASDGRSARDAPSRRGQVFDAPAALRDLCLEARRAGCPGGSWVS